MARLRLPPHGRGAGKAGARKRSSQRVAMNTQRPTMTRVSAKPGGPTRDGAAVNGRVAIRRIYEAPTAEDGTRVLIMRYWPRGIRKEKVDVWLRELGPVIPLLRAFLDEEITWAQYVPRYLAGLRRPEAQAALAEVRRLARQGRVTLLCGCADARQCHRTLLQRHLLDSGGEASS
jgi:uncharacterized protein YeaO (DUF488 family)